MNADWIWRNLLTYCMQVGLVVGLAAGAPSMLRIRMPRARLVFWQILLAVCLALPLLQSWRQAAAGGVEFSTVASGVRAAGSGASWTVPARMILWILAAGVVARLAWLLVGCIRLWIYRRRSQPHTAEMPLRTPAELRLSADVLGPVTFGFFRPMVLVPPQFPALDRKTQAAILAHELLHIERRDWLFTLAEEIIRSILWFHPAIWWLLGEIQLTREQAVDRAAIDVTHARDEYVDALLAVAGASTEADLAPAPLFLHRRQLKQRVLAILQEGPMSRPRIVSTMAAAFGTLALACWLVTATFPLLAVPRPLQRIKVGGNTQTANLVKQPRPIYPPEAKRQRVQGVVRLQAVIGKDGAVNSLEVVSGHPLLAGAALGAVRNWVYRPTLMNGKPVEVQTMIDVNFTLSK